LTPSSASLELGNPSTQQFTATVTTIPPGSSVTRVDFATSPGGIANCTSSDTSAPYTTTCDDIAVGTTTVTSTVILSGSPNTCNDTSSLTVVPPPTPTPTPSVGPIRLKGSFISTGENANSGYEFTRPVSVVGDAAPVTFEYDPKYLVDFVALMGEVLLDWIEVPSP
jgi:hypothetical protein